jgi:hypothetical protein
VFIKVHGVSPNASYTVYFDDSSCTEHTLVTDARGRGSGSYVFFPAPYTGNGGFFLFPAAAGHEYQTPEITF